MSWKTFLWHKRTNLKGLLSAGFELMDDKKSMLIEIKNVIIQMVHHSDEVIKVNFLFI
jgi:hypothetical protein